MRSVALIGPDGAGKSSIAREVARRVGVPARYLYMGVNLEQSSLTLPTTRLALAIKRARGRGAQMTADWSGDSRASGRPGLLREGYAGVRLLAWLAEEWFRVLVARIYNWRGYVVIFDRHFLFDYYPNPARQQSGQLLATRLHGMLLRRFYPRPDMVIVLDAPAEVLHARKLEQSVEILDRRRREYLALGSVVPDFNVVDATRPLPDVIGEITALIQTRLR